LQPSKSEPLYPGGHVSGWQQVPSDMHTSPLGQVRQVIAGSPQPAEIGWHEGDVCVLHVFGVQHVPSKHVCALVQAVALHVSVAPEHGSFQVSQALAGQAVAGVQHVPGSAFEHCWPLAQFVVQLTWIPVHGSVNVPQ
jgi:hypothetical protein